MLPSTAPPFLKLKSDCLYLLIMTIILYVESLSIVCFAGSSDFFYLQLHNIPLYVCEHCYLTVHFNLL